MSADLIAINAPHFYAGIVSTDGQTVTEAAPIVRYMTGWNLEQVVDYAEKKGWRLEIP